MFSRTHAQRGGRGQHVLKMLNLHVFERGTIWGPRLVRSWFSELRLTSVLSLSARQPRASPNGEMPRRNGAEGGPPPTLTSRSLHSLRLC